MAEASLKNRYFAKLSTNMASALCGGLTMLIVPKSLGVEDFGRFDFVTTTMALIVSTMSMGIPTAFFTWISEKDKKQSENIATGLAFIFLLGLGSLLSLMIFVGEVSHLNKNWWPDIPISILWLGLGMTMITSLWEIIGYLADAQALTIPMEIAKVLSFASRCVLVIALFKFDKLNIESYFLLNILVMLGILGPLLVKIRAFGGISWKIFSFHGKHDEVKRFCQFAFHFVKPMILLTFVGFAASYADRWILQMNGGSAQQGYYGLAFKIGAIALIFTSAMTPVITREFAVAFKEQDYTKLKNLFNKIKFFVFMASVLCVFLGLNSDQIIGILGRQQFQEAYWPVFIMCLYPIHQTFGHLSNSLFLATNRTGIYGKIGSIASVLGLPIAYFLLADKNSILPGADLGAIGLAIKMFAMQVIVSNVYLFYNVKFLNLSYSQWIQFQIFALAIPAILAGGARALISGIPSELLVIAALPLGPEAQTAVLRLILSGFVYLLLMSLLIIKHPYFLGLSHGEMRAIGRAIEARFQKVIGSHVYHRSKQK